MDLNPKLLLISAGILAGFIDSIAGGGGLITIPSLSLFLGLEASTIGTNKIAGTLSALVALCIYCSKGHMNWRRGWLFTLCISIGSFWGSFLAPFVSPNWFRLFLIITCPLLMWILWKKDLWVEKEPQHGVSLKSNPWIIAGLGTLCGFYDGIWGPGGGTFMFLSLFFVAKLPILTALAISKLANFTSAGVSLFNFARKGFVHWDIGLLLSAGIVVGAFSGSLLASRKASQIIRPLLLLIVSFLIVKFFLI